MAMTTRCPQCGTAFKVVPDQLRVRNGLVRCGACETVFDGRACLVAQIPQSAPAETAFQPPPAAPPPVAPPAASPVPPPQAVPRAGAAGAAPTVNAPSAQPDIPPGTQRSRDGGFVTTSVGPEPRILDSADLVREAPPAGAPALPPPPPLFQCATREGDRYLSEQAEPEPRCVPLRTVGLDEVDLVVGFVLVLVARRIAQERVLALDIGASAQHGGRGFGDQHRLGAQVAGDLRAGGKGVAGRDDLVARPDADGFQRQVQPRRGGIDRDGFQAGAQVFGEFLFEQAGAGAGGEPARLQRLDDRVDLGLADVRQCKRKKRGSHGPGRRDGDGRHAWRGALGAWSPGACSVIDSSFERVSVDTNV